MADSRGQARALTIITPILPGREETLRAVLGRLPDGADSPLARLPCTHFARWVVLRGEELLFSATHDPGQFDYLEEIRSRLPEEADTVWSHCRGYPGPGDGFVDWLSDHRVRTNLFVAAYPDATLDEVRDALAARRRLGAFVTGAQRLEPAQLKAAFREARLG